MEFKFSVNQLKNKQKKNWTFVYIHKFWSKSKKNVESEEFLWTNSESAELRVNLRGLQTLSSMLTG